MKNSHSKAGNTRLIIILATCLVAAGIYYWFFMGKTEPSEETSVPKPVSTELVSSNAPAASENVEQVGESSAPSPEEPYEWADGSTYEGGWVDGRRQGDGVYKWKSGSSYRGAWVAGKRQGKGLYTWPDGSKYDGEWAGDQPSGAGIFTWSSGSVYEGEWVEGKKEGKGVYRWNDGTEFEGLWRDGIQVEEVDDNEAGDSNSDYVST